MAISYGAISGNLASCDVVDDAVDMEVGFGSLVVINLLYACNVVVVPVWIIDDEGIEGLSLCHGVSLVVTDKFIPFVSRGSATGLLTGQLQISAVG